MAVPTGQQRQGLPAFQKASLMKRENMALRWLRFLRGGGGGVLFAAKGSGRGGAVCTFGAGRNGGDRTDTKATTASDT